MMKYFKMKKMELELKYALYSSIIAVKKEQENMIALMQKLYEALKDVPADELRDEFVSKIAKIVHESNQNKDAKS